MTCDRTRNRRLTALIQLIRTHRAAFPSFPLDAQCVPTPSFTLIMLLVSLLPLLALINLATADTLHIPLTRKSTLRKRDNTIDPAHFAKARDFLRVRYGYNPLPSNPKRRKRGQTVGIPTINSVSALFPDWHRRAVERIAAALR